MNEEFTFRLFAIPYFMRLNALSMGGGDCAAFFGVFCTAIIRRSRRTFAALNRSCGVVAGLVMLRWGIAATLIWHTRGCVAGGIAVDSFE